MLSPERKEQSAQCSRSLIIPVARVAAVRLGRARLKGQGIEQVPSETVEHGPSGPGMLKHATSM